MTDHEQIDELIKRFFGAFDNRNGRVPSLEEIATLFVPGAIVTCDRGSHCEQYSIPEFAEPRVRLLTSGDLVDFHEWETDASTRVVGSVATRDSRYRKNGRLQAQPYQGSGQKFFQLARLPAGWRISAVAWSDDG